MLQVIFNSVFFPDKQNIKEICLTDKMFEMLSSVHGIVFNESDEAIVDKSGVNSPRCYRHLGRAGVISLLHFNGLKEMILTRNVSGDKVGLYYASNPGTIDWTSASLIAKRGTERLSVTLREHLPPKQILKYGVNTACAQLGIFLGIRGPMYSYLDWRYSGKAQLDQAGFDLQSGIVDVAIVLASMGLEDPFYNTYLSGQDSRVMSEASACVVLSRKDGARSFAKRKKTIVDPLMFYGHCQTLLIEIEAMFGE